MVCVSTIIILALCITFWPRFKPSDRELHGELPGLTVDLPRGPLADIALLISGQLRQGGLYLPLLAVDVVDPLEGRGDVFLHCNFDEAPHSREFATAVFGSALRWMADVTPQERQAMLCMESRNADGTICFGKFGSPRSAKYFDMLRHNPHWQFLRINRAAAAAIRHEAARGVPYALAVRLRSDGRTAGLPPYLALGGGLGVCKKGPVLCTCGSYIHRSGVPGHFTQWRRYGDWLAWGAAHAVFAVHGSAFGAMVRAANGTSELEKPNLCCGEAWMTHMMVMRRVAWFATPLCPTIRDVYYANKNWKVILSASNKTFCAPDAAAIAGWVGSRMPRDVHSAFCCNGDADTPACRAAGTSLGAELLGQKTAKGRPPPPPLCCSAIAPIPRPTVLPPPTCELPPDFDALASWRPNPAAVSSEAADAAASAIAAALPPAPPLTDGSAPASTPASPASPAAPE